VNHKHLTALVTGASRGIGRAIALAYAREGIDLVVTARTVEDLDSLKAETEALGVRCSNIVADLSLPDAVDTITKHLQGNSLRVDVLINNAGIGTGGCLKPVHAFDDDYWALSLQVNLTVPYLLTKHLLPPMMERQWGRIINIASLASKFGLSHGAAYTASKHGLLGLTRTTAAETANRGITANAICPGPTRTRANNERIQFEAERTEKTLEEIEASITPLGRRLMPEEVAAFAVYLIGKQAAGVTGQSFNIDGGLLMS